MYGLIDGNNFFVSCERVLDPKLRGKPTVVLGNADGCAIAISPEAKALGVRMGTPIFQVSKEVRSQLEVRSANFACTATSLAGSCRSCGTCSLAWRCTRLTRISSAFMCSMTRLSWLWKPGSESCAGWGSPVAWVWAPPRPSPRPEIKLRRRTPSALSTPAG